MIAIQRHYGFPNSTHMDPGNLTCQIKSRVCHRILGAADRIQIWQRSTTKHAREKIVVNCYTLDTISRASCELRYCDPLLKSWHSAQYKRIASVMNNAPEHSWKTNLILLYRQVRWKWVCRTAGVTAVGIIIGLFLPELVSRVLAVVSVLLGILGIALESDDAKTSPKTICVNKVKTFCFVATTVALALTIGDFLHHLSS